MHPSGITRHEMSSTVSTLSRSISAVSVMSRGLRWSPLRTDCMNVSETASAAIRGSMTPGSELAISRVSNIGA